MQDVASGTRSVKLSTGRRATILNAVRTVHKAEIIRLYTSACDKEGYTKEKELCGTSSTTAQHHREKVYLVWIMWHLKAQMSLMN